MAIVYGPEFKNPPLAGAVRAMAIGNRNLREGPGLKYPVIGTFPESKVAMLTQYNTWENPGDWKPGVPDRWWALLVDSKDQLMGWACMFEGVSAKGGPNSTADVVYKTYCWQIGKTIPSADDYAAAVKQQQSETKKFNAIVNAKKATGEKIPADREPLPDSGDAPSSMAAPLAIGALALLAWKFWPK